MTFCKGDDVMKMLYLKEEIPEIEEVQRVAYWLAVKGWSEATAGNISVRLERKPDILTPKAVKKLEFLYDGPEMYMLVTKTGSRMRDVADDPENLCLVHVKKGHEYEILAGSEEVTSEFPTHLMVQAKFLEWKMDKRAIVHTHPQNLIALMNLPDFPKYLKMLLKIHPEVPIFFPEGIDMVEYEKPGSLILGIKTVEKLKEKNAVLWEKHGIVASGRNVSEASDRVEILEKAAEILLKILCLCKEPSGIPEIKSG